MAHPVLISPSRKYFRMMAKRAQGRNRFFRQSSFKPRYFRLTTHSLSYAKSKGQKPTCDIPLRDILAVEPLHEQNFKLQNIFQVKCAVTDYVTYLKCSHTSPRRLCICGNWVHCLIVRNLSCARFRRVTWFNCRLRWVKL